jgi:hypothetical protein
MTFVEALRVEPEHILTKDHLVPRFHNGVRVEFIWNIRPADLRCNRLKGNKTLVAFRNERPGMIDAWLNSLPSDDWRVREWDGYPMDAEIEASIEARFPQAVEDRAQQSTGVFALASGSALGSGVEVEKVKKGAVFALASPSAADERTSRNRDALIAAAKNHIAERVGVVPPSPLSMSAAEMGEAHGICAQMNREAGQSPLEEQAEPGLLKKLIRERDGDVSWAWRNPA